MRQSLACRLGRQLALLALVVPAAAPAQYAPADRFELGRRLHAVEAAWQAHPDPAARRRAIPFLNAATRAFLFTPHANEVGRDLDRARLALDRDGEPEPAVLWAAALAIRPATRLLDPGAGRLGVTLAPFYPVTASLPHGVRLRLALVRADGRTSAGAADLPVARVPCDVPLSLDGVEEGDYTLRAEIRTDDRVPASREQTVSVVRRPGERLRRLEEALKAGPAQADDADLETLRALVKVLTALERKETLETNYPAARLLREAEAAVRARAAGRRYYGAPRAGDFWLTLPLPKGSAPVRLLAPEAVRQGQPLPLVVALHGAGGTENLFFEAYGGGAVVRRCRERGWLLVAPRGSLFELTPPLADLVDAVGRLYPIDRRRVFVVGHSLGAVQAVNAARQAPRTFAAVAALGGGMAVAPAPGLGDVPFFVGEGADDPVLRHGGRRLVESLDRAGVRTLLFRSYADAEHLTVVAAALDDVFAFFDRASRK